MVEPELSFINQTELHSLTEDFIKYVVKSILDNHTNELEMLNTRDKNLINRLNVIVNEPFTLLEYKDAIQILKDNFPEKLLSELEMCKDDIKFGLDLPSQMEKYLTEEYYCKPVMIYNYPKCIKSFYMKSNDEPENTTVQAMDLLVPIVGELIGGSIREDNFNKLNNTLKEKNIKNLDWYLDLRKYGSVPHGGFGLGFERLVQLCTGMNNIRDVIPYPRYPKHVIA